MKDKKIVTETDYKSALFVMKTSINEKEIEAAQKIIKTYKNQQIMGNREEYK